MEFTGTIYYNFESIDVWRIYSILLRASSQAQVKVDVSWAELPGQGWLPDEPMDGRTRLLASCAAVAKDAPEKHQRFVQALLTLVFEQKDDPDKETTLLVAAKVAGLEGSALLLTPKELGQAALLECRSRAEEQGIVAAPSIVRHGPPLHIRTTGALGQSNPIATIELLNRMLDDDGIWALSKP